MPSNSKPDQQINTAGTNGDLKHLENLLLARAPKEDLEPFSAEARQHLTEIAYQLLKGHKLGGSSVNIAKSGAVSADGRDVTIITIVNDNMPFLFDSVLGEVTNLDNEPLLVIHPILPVLYDAQGSFSAVAASTSEGDAKRVSLVQILSNRLSEDETANLEARLQTVLSQVHVAVRDWQPMLARLDQATENLRQTPNGLESTRISEASEFLNWLRADNFTFLGMREFKYSGNEEDGALVRSDEPGLGILTDPDVRVLSRGDEAAATTSEIRAFLHGPEAILVTKANAKSNVHRRAYLDYIGIKSFTADGKLSGELRIVGLFTSTAYTRSVMQIPYLNAKAKAVVEQSGFDLHDHSGKALVNVLETYPRDELFQIDLPTLRNHVEAIVALDDHPRVRVLPRLEQFDRFVSVLVYIPRDRYDSDTRERIGDYLRTIYEGRLSAYFPYFQEGGLTRVQFIIGRSNGATPKIPQAQLEEAVRAIIRNWDDGLREANANGSVPVGILSIASAFPQAYRDSFSPQEGLVDATQIAALSPDAPIAIDYYHDARPMAGPLSLKIYHYGDPVPLSKRVPILENMGFRVISERTFALDAGTATNGDHAPHAYLHDMELESAFGRDVTLKDDGDLFDSVFLSIWNGASDNDGFNGLAHSAGMNPAEIAVLRTYGRFIQQAGVPQSQEFIADVLNRYSEIAKALIRLFTARLGTGDEAAEKAAEAAILADLDEVPSLDDDTILRRFLNIIQATLRTNHFMQMPPQAGRSIALKLNSRAISGLPEPRPWREIFVYGPEVEGVHLRFGEVARGGLRLSDRAQDYRTEVLGLVKAQQVKNAVIVPVGAKGGFYPKKLPIGGTRDEIFEAGRQAYINFISTMVSITDNIEGDHVVPPENVVRQDGDDPYFVVAADKGTATFSDTANAISQDHDFWLDDAFASGGSAGYDHKEMGITAKGAWEAVKRHFRELNRDIQTEPFTAAGVGDMSGDVFGNGMLLSRQTRLIAAFDHRDIFIDPTPDATSSYEERQRLFELPRSSWQDYDKALLSPGGMIIPRNLKSVQLTPQAAAALDLGTDHVTPIEIMKAVLKSKVDLLWFGGIGTYLRAAPESNAEVGDRANDNIRVTGNEVRAIVIGEGANLGVTQAARIEYSLAGGRCNSDAIDNSAGVNSSDIEVNIKIALAAAMRSGKLTRDNRNILLHEMTQEVSDLVLANNYHQPLALSMAERRAHADLPHYRRLMAKLEQRGLLDRVVEGLPSEATLDEREKRGQSLTRPELGVLLAYAKLTLFSDLVETNLLDDPFFEKDLLAYFPAHMVKSNREEILTHRLRREIIATQLANDIINRGGPAFISQMQEMGEFGADQVVRAYVLVRDGFDLPKLYDHIDQLDTRIDGSQQLGLYSHIYRMTFNATIWMLNYGQSQTSLGEQVSALRDASHALQPMMTELITPAMQKSLAEHTRKFIDKGASETLGGELAELDIARRIPDIMRISAGSGAALALVAKAFFAATDLLRINRLEEVIAAQVPVDEYDGLALGRAADQISSARRAIAAAALTSDKGGTDPVSHWAQNGGERVEHALEQLKAISEGEEIGLSRLIVAAGLLTDLAEA